MVIWYYTPEYWFFQDISEIPKLRKSWHATWVENTRSETEKNSSKRTWEVKARYHYIHEQASVCVFLIPHPPITQRQRHILQ